MTTDKIEFDSKSVVNKIFNDDVLVDKIKMSKILLVGAGGIGCEVIKNLVLLGFKYITVIDLDTIDVSNLNRQFLFGRTHVGQSKSQVAALVANDRYSHLNDKPEIKSIHGSIQSSEYNVNFFKTFSLVINALDNRAARSHVNRMCLAAGVPLIESGSEGYLGQVFSIKKSLSACYECQGTKQDQRTYASCTIRNTPSLPIHCIVWGKHLFAQLFGETDTDNDVSPDMTDKEINPEHIKNSENEVPIVNYSNHHENGQNSRKLSTREWAEANEFNPNKLFRKLFYEDINYLLIMDKLWEKRRKPIPLTEENLETLVPSSSNESLEKVNVRLDDQRLWSLHECFDEFSKSLKTLKDRLDKEKNLIWDKDEEDSLNFVTAVSNLRSQCFGIEKKSKFDVKSMAGNIIPAISSTNSIVGGLIVLQAMRILKLEKETDNEVSSTLYKETCKHIYLRKVSLTARNLIASYELNEPNKHCFICSGETPEIDIKLNLNETLMVDFVEEILIKKLNFVCPDILIDGTPIILWSKDECDEEDEQYRKKRLIDYPHIENDVRLRVTDLIQENSIIIITLKNEQIDVNDNEGLFYQIIMTNEGNNKEKEDLNGDKVENEITTTTSTTITTTNINKLNDHSNDVFINGKEQLINKKTDDAEIIYILDENESDEDHMASTGKKLRTNEQVYNETITIDDDGSTSNHQSFNSEDSVEFIKAEINKETNQIQDEEIEEDVIEIESTRKRSAEDNEIFSLKKKKLSDT